jgi:hypothetical protein
MPDSVSRMPRMVRHGESAGNVARDAAHAARKPRIELTMRDMDVPLSPRGGLRRWVNGIKRMKRHPSRR